EPQRLLEVRAFKSRPRFGHIKGLALNRFPLPRQLIIEVLAKLEAVEPAHSDCLRPNQDLNALPTISFISQPIVQTKSPENKFFVLQSPGEELGSTHSQRETEINLFTFFE